MAKVKKRKTDGFQDTADLFAPFVDFNFLLKRSNGFRDVETPGNNLLFLKNIPLENVNDSGVENKGTDWMLKRMGDGNFKFSRRWAWLYRHYIWAYNVTKGRAHLVDLGCDVGEIRNLISKSFYTKNPLYVGVDMGWDRLKAGAAGIQMRIPAIYIQHDVTTGLGFLKDHSVDYIMAGEIIEHFKKKFGKLFLKEIHRVLVKGGMVMLSTPNRRHTKNYDFHVYEYGVPELVAMVKEVGFKVKKVYGWTTTEKCVRENPKLYKQLGILKRKINKDLVVPFMAYLDPEVSEAFCIEAEK